MRGRPGIGALSMLAGLGMLAACAAPPPPGVIPHDHDSGVEVSLPAVSYGPDAVQRADIYRSDGDEGTIVYLHGGAWAFGSRANVPSLLLYEVSRGWDLVSIDYTLSPDAPFPRAVRDTATALRWLREHGPGLGLDVSRVVLSGWSAGANIAALAAFGANDGGFPGGEVPAVDGAVFFAGAYDLAPLDMVDLEGPGGWLFGVESGRVLASPVSWLDGSDPAVMAVHGRADSEIPLSQLRALRDASAASGHTERLVTLEVTDPRLEERCRRHEPWCGTPVAQLEGFLGSL